MDQRVSTCRVCGDHCNLQQCLSIFQQNDGTTYADMIAFCCQLLITIDDNLPEEICFPCCTQLKDAYNFCLKCRTTDANLRFGVELNQAQGSVEELPAKIVDALIELPATKPKNTNEILVDLMMQEEDELFDEIIEENHFSDDESLDENAGELVDLLTTSVILDNSTTVQEVGDCQTLRSIDDPHEPVCTNMQSGEETPLIENYTVICMDNEDMPEELEDVTNNAISFVEEAEDDEVISDFDDETSVDSLIHSTNKIPASKRPMLVLPPEEMIVEREDHGEYQVIFYSGIACCGCTQYFSCSDDLEDHCRKEHQLDDPQGQYYCPLCYKQFRGLNLQMRHCNQRTIPKLFYCTLCKYVCREKAAIDRHMVSTVIHNKPMMDFDKVKEAFEEVPVVGYMCCDCFEMFSDEEQLSKHYKEAHHAGRPCSKDKALITGVEWCEKCHLVFKNKHKYEAHISNANMNTIYCCKHEFCNYRTANIVFARFHLRSKDHDALASKGHQDEAEKETEEYSDRRCCFRKCQQVFKSREALLEHVDKVHQSKQLENELRRKKSTNVCSICNCNFGSRRALRLHRQPKFKDFVCDKCGLKVGSIFQLQHHIKQVHNNIRVQRDFKCDECPRAFVSAVNLRRHKQQGHEDFVCTICEKRFQTKEGLWLHWRMHNNVGKYECESCKKAGKRYLFRDLRTLNRHYKISEMHTGIRKHKCSFEGCPNTYAHKPDLKRHELTVHQGIRPFTCTFCLKGFIRNRDLRLHERTHTGAKLYTCDTCSAGFDIYQEFKRHCSEKHGVSILIPQTVRTDL